MGFENADIFVNRVNAVNSEPSIWGFMSGSVNKFWQACHRR